MSPKRIIIILTLFAALATVLVGFAAGSGRGNDQQRQKGTKSGPIKGSPRLSPGETERYWTPERMRHARPAPMGVPGPGKKSPPASSSSNAGRSTPGSPPSGR
jgi:hypothetical protein